MVAYVASGSEFIVNSTFVRSQAQSSVALLANGNFIVSWIDADFNTTAGRFIRAQVYQPDGTPVGSELTLVSASSLIRPVITGLANGGFVVTWDGFTIRAQVFDANGVATGAAFDVSPVGASSADFQDVTALPNGGFAITWHDTRTTGADITGSGVHLKTYDQTGVLVGSDVLVNTQTTGNQADTSITTLAGGGYVVTWTDRGAGGGNWVIKARIFDAAGSPVGSEIAVNPSSGSLVSSVESSVTTLANGNFAVAWYEGGQHHIKVYTPTGALVGTEVLVATFFSGTQVGPELAALSDGGFAITWRENVAPMNDGSGIGLFVQVFDADAQSTGPRLQVNTQTNGDQTLPSIVGLANGTFVVTWTDLNGPTADDDEVRAQIFAPQGALAITSDGGGETADLTAPENSLAVTQVSATGTNVSFAITGGADASLFTINAATGALSFIAAPNYEAPADAGADNVYDVVVSASDGVNTDSQSLAVTVTNTNEGLSFTTDAAFGVLENNSVVATVSATDLDGDTVTYAIAGGADAALFAVDAATGALSFIAAPNFETPSDAGGDNVYDVTVSATDGSFTATSAIAVSVSNANEAVSITSGAAFGVSENSTSVTTVTANDIDGDAVTFAIAGGADAALFAIDAATGALSFVDAPNFEAPGDAGADNQYEVLISASDGSLLDTQSLFITVTNTNEAVSITSGAAFGVSENSTSVTTVTANDIDGDAVTFAIAGGADAALFAIDAATGALSFVAAPDFEAPGDAGSDNVYDVVVQASDGVFTDAQTVTISVTNTNEAPIITSNGGGESAAISISENSSSVTTVTATDPDGNPRTYTIAGGADAARFAIDAATGALSFVAAPDFEAPADDGANNIYDVVVQASDGSLVDTQTLAVTITNVNEAPVITSNGGGATASIIVNENTTAVTTVTSTDPEGTARTYAIAGGADAAKFTINAATGVLSFISTPNFEAPTDVGANNVYDVIVRASDGINLDTQALAVTVANVVDGSTINGTSGGNTLTGTLAEDTINGLGGNDTINGGGGADTLTGGTGADRFLFSQTTHSVVGARDIITDFSRSQGDRISVNPMDANTNVANNQNFTFIGNAAFSNVAGQLRFEQVSGNTFVSGDVNGDGAGDFSIQVNGLVNFIASDFIL